jgi:hypothetical protein
MPPGFIKCIANPTTTQNHRRHHIKVGNGIVVVRGKHEGRLGQVLAFTAKCYKIHLVESRGFDTSLTRCIKKNFCRRHNHLLVSQLNELQEEQWRNRMELFGYSRRCEWEELDVSSPVPSDCFDADEDEFLKKCKNEVEELRNSLDFI